MAQGALRGRLAPVQLAPTGLKAFRRPKREAVSRARWEWSQAGINAQALPWKWCWARPAASQGPHYLCRLLRTLSLLPLPQMDPHRGQNSKGWGRLKAYGGWSTIATDRTTPTSASSFKIRWLKAECVKLLSGVMS